MQQTDKYKLNLIEMPDTFSPAPLNENMEKVEAAITAEISAEAQARADADTAEAQARIAAVNSEAQARAAADTAETQARITAVNSETQARIAADNAEAGTRAAADNALGARVQVLEARRIVCGSYVDNGTPQTIELGFTPALVLVHMATGEITAMALEGKPYNKFSQLSIVPGGFSAQTTFGDPYKGTYYYLAIL